MSVYCARIIQMFGDTVPAASFSTVSVMTCFVLDIMQRVVSLWKDVLPSNCCSHDQCGAATWRAACCLCKTNWYSSLTSFSFGSATRAAALQHICIRTPAYSPSPLAHLPARSLQNGSDPQASHQCSIYFECTVCVKVHALIDFSLCLCVCL